MKPMAKPLIMLFVLLSFLSQDIQAKGKGPTVDRPTLTPGDSWNYLYNGDPFSVTFKEVESDFLLFKTLYKNTIAGVRYQTKDLNYIKLVVGSNVIWENDPDNGQLNFPLSVGKSWNHTYASRSGPNTNTRTTYAKVVDYEQLTI